MAARAAVAKAEETTAAARAAPRVAGVMARHGPAAAALAAAALAVAALAAAALAAAQSSAALANTLGTATFAVAQAADMHAMVNSLLT